MSQETMQWLNQNTLIGFTDKRGTAWHYRASDQGAESNHYSGAIPQEDVLRRLFDWQPLEVPVAIPAIGVSFDDGHALTERKAVIRSDNRHLMGIFSEGYKPHPYDEWLLEQVSSILDDTLQIGSAGLLKGGAIGWVSVEVPDYIETPEGVRFRPFLLATTSFDGSISTTYKRCVQNVVCDNTMAVAMGEKGQTYRVKHTRNSQAKLADAREALAIVHTIADEFMAQVSEWCATPVSDRQFEATLEALIPTVDEEGERKQGSALTRALNKHNELTGLWNDDPRCTPWKGNKYGVVQAFNTWEHHVASQRGATARAERNMENVILGNVETKDAKVALAVDGVLAAC